MRGETLTTKRGLQVKKIVVVLAIVFIGSATLISKPSLAANCQAKYDKAHKAFEDSMLDRLKKEKVQNLLQKAADFNGKGKKKKCLKQVKKAMKIMNK